MREVGRGIFKEVDIRLYPYAIFATTIGAYTWDENTVWWCHIWQIY